MHSLRCQAQRAGQSFFASIRTSPQNVRFLTLLPNSSPQPWFVDPEPSSPLRHPPPHLVPKTREIPPNLPESVKELFQKLSESPYLELSTLEVKKPSPPPPGPPLPFRIPKGRRQRGGTYSGESILEDHGGLWNWVVTAQVKEGTESRGAIESVVRLVRKTLLKMNPPVPLPPNSKRRGHHGWAMLDAGTFAVHILSRDARLKYFENQTQW